MTPKTVEYFIFLPEVREFIKDTNFINPTARARATDSDTCFSYYTVVCVYPKKVNTQTYGLSGFRSGLCGGGWRAETHGRKKQRKTWRQLAVPVRSHAILATLLYSALVTFAWLDFSGDFCMA